MTALDRIRHIALVLMIVMIACGCGGAGVYAEDFAECEIPAVCSISGDIPDSLDMDFTYTLRADDPGSPMPEGSENGVKTVHMTDSGKLDFGTIRFSNPDVFYYTLAETTEEADGFRRDRTRYRAALMVDSDGHVTTVITSDSGTKTGKAAFRNTYRKKTDSTERTEGTVPRTGDTGAALWIMLTFLSGAGLVIMIRGKQMSVNRMGHRVRRKQMSVSGMEHRFREKQISVSGMEHGYKCAGPGLIRFFGLAAIVSLFVMMPACQGEVYAEIDVTNDYSELPVNNVKIGSMDFDDAEFTSLDSRIKKGDFQYYQNGEAVNAPTIYWVSSTAPKFGTTSATSTADAKLGSNSISGDIFTLKFAGAATLPDGEVADVLLTFSDLWFGLSKNVNGTTGSKYYYPIIKAGSDGNTVYCNTSIGTSTKNSGRIKGLSAATRIRTTMTIVDPDTDEPVDEMDYILGFRDLDVQDNTSATGSNVDRYAKHYSEGIGLISGFGEPAYLTEDTLIRQDTWDNVTKLRGTANSSSGIKSGFDIPVSTAGFSYYWYGTRVFATSNQTPGGAMGTTFGISPEVDVLASSGAGGTIEKEGERSYLVNSSTSYAYTPAAGYKVRELIVDGESVPFNKSGGTYVFGKLTETSEEDYDHTIEVRFHKPLDIKIAKNVKGPLGDRSKMFSFTVTLSGLDTDEVFEITQDSTGTFTGVGSSGTRVSSKSFRPSSSGRAVLELTMKDDQFIRISSLTGEAHYTVAESASDHIASYTVSGSGAAPVIARASSSSSGKGQISTETETIDADDGMVTILFNNEKGIAAPTGVRDGRTPYLIALGLFTVLAVISAVIRSLKREQDTNG
ncbi:MAG: hypothetical protein IJH41_04335 [Eubacterium sp.]|nr:hypothetical protein [Eubacterium sp.]